MGRFLNVDPVVADPLNAQNYNGYSYCINNPLKYTDPSGYQQYAYFRPYIEFNLSSCSPTGGSGGGGGGSGFGQGSVLYEVGPTAVQYDNFVEEQRLGNIAPNVTFKSTLHNNNREQYVFVNCNYQTKDANYIVSKKVYIKSAKSGGGYDWGGITNATLSALGGCTEIVIGVSAEAVSMGLSTALIIDGGIRVGTNVTRLGFYFAGNSKVGGAIPGNAGAIIGKGIDMSTGKSFYDYGYGQGLLGTTNDFVSFAVTGGTASSLGNFVENPSLYNAVNYGVTYLGYNNSMFNNLYPLTQPK